MQQNATVGQSSPRLGIEQQISAISTEQIKLARTMRENAERKMKLELTLLTMDG